MLHFSKFINAAPLVASMVLGAAISERQTEELPTLSFNTIPTLKTCTKVPITWQYTGPPGANLSLYITPTEQRNDTFLVMLLGENPIASDLSLPEWLVRPPPGDYRFNGTLKETPSVKAVSNVFTIEYGENRKCVWQVPDIPDIPNAAVPREGPSGAVAAVAFVSGLATFALI